MTVIAAFDVDGTLTTRDSVVPFLGRFARRPSRWKGVIVALPGLVAALAKRDRDLLRERATAALLTGIEVADLEHEAAALAEIVIADRLRPDTTARLRWHVDQGHRVVLVSASYEVYLRHLVDHLGAEVALATRLQAVDGRLTGRLDGVNCRGPEKVARLDGWMTKQGLDRSDIELWAYGDSAGDAELLAEADRSVWVREPLDSVAPV